MRMRNRTAAVALAAGLVAVASESVRIGGQPRTALLEPALPRLPDGHPDFQGVYDLATLTPLERPATFRDSPTLSLEDARQLESQAAALVARAAQPSDPRRSAPPVGGDGSTGAAGNVGGYNRFWIDPGTTYVTIGGQSRTSIIVDPPNGRVPPFLPAAEERSAERLLRTPSDEPENDDPGLEVPGAYDDPERRPLSERCLTGFGSTSGPPALPVLYDNLHQIVQANDTVLLFSEMVHEVRVVRINGVHLPSSVRRWSGDSVGRWEGDTLVIDTTNFADQTRFRGSGEDLHVIERFSRVDAKTLLYRFTVEDPSTWATPWTGEYTWPLTDHLLYEYACHEANYALGNILRGARLRERGSAIRLSPKR